jgi:large subunit ribosomal protein L29
MKVKEMRDQTVEELKEKVISLRKELFDLRLKKATFKLENTSDISKKRKMIAQIKTIMKEKLVQK